MNDHSLEKPARAQVQPDGEIRYYKKDFWRTENLKYSEPHFRMRKLAWLVRGLAGDRVCDLLDVGCGPATMSRLMPPNVHYHGIDIAIPEPAENLIEMDILESPIGFRGMKFDFVVAQGMFEYVGSHQTEKFAEIADVLKDDGKFVLTYQNFDHRKEEIYWPYSNVQRPAEFRADLRKYFKIERSFPASHNWNHSQPNRKIMRVSQARLRLNVPFLSPLLAVDYVYVCSPLRPAPGTPPHPGAALRD
jgi:cyclopropane fatty-acyl-phospholipid synthase-like methyltransferase